MDSIESMLGMVTSSEGLNLPSIEDISDTKSYIQIFLIAQAKRELKRVVELTNTLDRLQDIYQEKAMNVIENINNDELLVMDYLPSILKTITSCLDRSNKIIGSIIGDNELFNILYVDNRTDINNSNVIANNMHNDLKDPVSRARVRDSIKQIMDIIDNKTLIDKEEFEEGSDVVDI